MMRDYYHSIPSCNAPSPRADLHLHTTASDGCWSPEQLAGEALSRGIRTIAVTDHDTVASIDAVLSGAPAQIRVIPGIELSTEEDNCEVHILGYWIDRRDDDLLTLLEQLTEERLQRTKVMVSKLRKLGCQITFEQVHGLAGAGVIGRVHIAQALVQSKACHSVSDAFDQFLRAGRPGYVRRSKLLPSEAIEVIKNAGGVAVLAHPSLIGDDALVAKVLSEGLDGMEIIHSCHGSTQQKHYWRMCQKAGLLPSGGSDCHGPGGKDEVLIGRWSVPETWVDALYQRWLTFAE